MIIVAIDDKFNLMGTYDLGENDSDGPDLNSFNNAITTPSNWQFLEVEDYLDQLLAYHDGLDKPILKVVES